MSECGDFHNCPIAEHIREMAVENAKQTVIAERNRDDTAEIKKYLLGQERTIRALDRRIENIEERTERHDKLAEEDRAKRERRFQRYEKIFWYAVGPALGVLGTGSAALLVKLLWWR